MIMKTMWTAVEFVNEHGFRCNPVREGNSTLLKLIAEASSYYIEK